MATKEAQLNLRLPADLDAWVESHVDGKRQKPEFVRQILERERAREEEERMLNMFDTAWDSLSPEAKAEIREEREEWMDACGGQSVGE